MSKGFPEINAGEDRKRQCSVWRRKGYVRADSKLSLIQRIHKVFTSAKSPIKIRRGGTNSDEEEPAPSHPSADSCERVGEAILAGQIQIRVREAHHPGKHFERYMREGIGRAGKPARRCVANSVILGLGRRTYNEAFACRIILQLTRK